MKELVVTHVFFDFDFGLLQGIDFFIDFRQRLGIPGPEEKTARDVRNALERPFINLNIGLDVALTE